MTKRLVKASAHTTAVLLCTIISIPVLAQGGVDTSPPTAPIELIAVATSDSEIRLSWDPATDDQQVVSYQVSRGDVIVSRSNSTIFTDTNLRGGTRYTYSIVASDGTNLSRPAIATVSTLQRGTSIDPGARPSVLLNDPAPPLSVFRVMSAPPGYTNLVFSDEFDGTGPLDVTGEERNWRFETMDDGLHRAGNSGIDENGNVITGGNSVRGKRWSGWYNDLNDENTFRSNGLLVMQGRDSGLLDLTRPIDYLDNGTVTEFGSSKLYTSWIDTFSRVFDNDFRHTRQGSQLSAQIFQVWLC